MKWSEKASRINEWSVIDVDWKQSADELYNELQREKEKNRQLEFKKNFLSDMLQRSIERERKQSEGRHQNFLDMHEYQTKVDEMFEPIRNKTVGQFIEKVADENAPMDANLLLYLIGEYAKEVKE